MNKCKKILLASLTGLTLCSAGCKDNILSNSNTSSNNSSSSSAPTYQTDNRFMVNKVENAQIIQLSYEEVEAKILRKESFVLFIKQAGCQGCQNFSPILEKYISDNKINVYSIELSDIPSDGKLYFTYTPTLQIFKDGEMIDSKDPINAESKMFTNIDDLEKYLDQYIVINNQLYISDTTLDTMIENNETFVVYFSWKSCGDCQMLNKLFLNEYLYNTRESNYTLYTLEVDPWRSQKVDNPEVWEDFTAKYHLSKISDEVFGYRTGVVPTIQYYVNGKLSDVVVYFNDVLIAVTNDSGEISGYKIDFEAEDGVFSYYPEDIIVEFGDTIFTDYQAYKDETNDFYKAKLLELFNKAL